MHESFTRSQIKCQAWRTSVDAGCLSLCAEFTTAARLCCTALACTIARGTICWRVAALEASKV
jgi:hypothetical protein